MKTYLFPGMGADRRMYPGPWRNLVQPVFVEWRGYAGEVSINALAAQIVRDEEIEPDDVLVGASLGGIVACAIAKHVPVAALVLVGSAKDRQEINRLVSLFHPLIDLTPLKFAQRFATSVPSDLARMFSETDPTFIRSMCRAIFTWDGLGRTDVNLVRIHGRMDHVIPLPQDVQHVLDGGHLIAMTHAQQCVDIVKTKPWFGSH